MEKKDKNDKKDKKEQKERPVTVHITNHNQFQKGVGAFITNLNHLTLVMDAEGNMKMGMGQIPVLPQTTVETAEGDDEVDDDEGDEGQEEAAGGVNDDKEKEELVAQLKPIFYNNEEDVRLFLKMIRGMAQEDITELVNSWVAEKRISNYGTSRKGKLWKILHDAGLYTKTRTNWNSRVH